MESRAKSHVNLFLRHGPLCLLLCLFALATLSGCRNEDSVSDISQRPAESAAASRSQNTAMVVSSGSMGANPIEGTDRDDIIIGTTGPDYITGGDGDDYIVGDPASPQVDEFDVVYGSALVDNGNAEKDLLLDIYQPEGLCDQYRPFVLIVHGGGFVGGSKSQQSLVDIANALTARGYVAISIDYRLKGENPVPSSTYLPIAQSLVATTPADELNDREFAIASAIEDTVTAIRWIELNDLERCIDSTKFAMTGGSAGTFTHMTYTYGLDEFQIPVPVPQAVVHLWGGTLFEDTLAFNDPPLMMIHGTLDTTASHFDQAERIEGEALAQSVPYTFYSVTGGTHGFSGSGYFTTFVNGKSLFEHSIDFIDAHLGDAVRTYEGRVTVDKE